MSTLAPKRPELRKGRSQPIDDALARELDLARTLKRASEIAALKAAKAERLAPHSTGTTYAFLVPGFFLLSIGVLLTLTCILTGFPFHLVGVAIVGLGALLVCCAPQPKATQGGYRQNSEELAELSASFRSR